MSKEFTALVTRKVTKIEMARIKVRVDNKSEVKGVAKYMAIHEPADWEASDDEITVISSKIVGEDSKP